MAFSRREFLMQVGKTSGYSAAFVTMQAMGLLPAPAASALAVVPANGKGTRVAVLGAGIAGLVAAYELSQQGYSVTLLEPHQRPGGRNWSVRRGTQVNFLDGFQQTCEYDAGHYQNFGPARLPSIHKTMLGYCHKLGVPLEVEINTSRSTLLQADPLNGGKAVTQRQIINDTRGHVSELLAKCIGQGGLDQDITLEDKERMISFLRIYGDLDQQLRYSGSERAGYRSSPGAGPAKAQHLDPLAMHELLTADLWNGILSEDVIDWQATMFQPVGGMDQIPYAFSKQLGSIVRYGVAAESIQQSDSGVTIGYKELKTGKTGTLQADYCICAMPLTIARKLKADWSPDVKTVLDNSEYVHAYKIAWEAPRFWEKDFNIYGGLGYAHQDVGIVWYPSWGLFSDRGVVVSGYTDERNTPFGKLSREQKFASSRRTVDLLHPGYGKLLDKPIYVQWSQIEWQEGSWIGNYGSTDEEKNAACYTRICEPDRRVYFAGDHTSHLVGWQEGAALSAIRAANSIGERVKARA